MPLPARAGRPEGRPFKRAGLQAAPSRYDPVPGSIAARGPFTRLWGGGFTATRHGRTLGIVTFRFAALRQSSLVPHPTGRKSAGQGLEGPVPSSNRAASAALQAGPRL